MKWLTEFIEDLQQGKDYERLSEELNECQKGQNHLQRKVDSLEEQLEEKDKELLLVYSDLEETEQQLQSQKTVIDAVKASELLTRSLPNSPYLHPVNGLNNPKQDIKFFLDYDSNNEYIKRWADSVDLEYAPATPEEIVESVQKFFIYKEPNLYKKDSGEKWNLAQTTLERIESGLKNDCEDVAIAMNVLIQELFRRKNFSEHTKRLFLCVAKTYAEVHALNLWMHTDGYLYPVESTMDLKGTYNMKWLQTPLAKDSFYMKFYGVAIPGKSFLGSNALRKQYMVIL